MIAITSLICILAAATPEESAPLKLPEINSAILTPATFAPEVVEKDAIELPQSEVHLTQPKAPLTDLAPAKIETRLIKAPLDEESIQIQKVSEQISAEEEAFTAQAPVQTTKHVQINMREVFSGAPIIYSILVLMSLGALTLWIYHMMLMRKEKLMPSEFADSVENRLAVGNWQDALALCRKENSLLSTLIQAAITARHEGSQAMIERMQTEGKRATSFFWQRLSLLNDIALIAPMIGLLGTVLGMFYAFYDINRSVDSMYALFDGLGISVGTTVAGLILAIISLFFHSTLKYRLVRQLSTTETKAQKIALNPSAHAIHTSNAQLKDTHEFNT
jgi:biopolymer transport protein ExbB